VTRRPRPARRAWAVAMAALALGCAARGPAPPVLPEPVPLAADDPLLATLVAGWSEVVAATRAPSAVLQLTGPQGERRLSQDLVVARPDRIRMEIQAFLTTAAVLVADGAEYDYFESLGRYRERGPVHPQLLWQIAGVPLTIDQAVDFLLGSPPPRPGLRPAGGAVEPDGLVRVDLADGAGRLVRRLRFDTEGRLVGGEGWSAGGQLRWRVGYDRWRDVGEQPFAHEIEFEFPGYQAAATVAFRSVALNPETPDALFELGLDEAAE